MRNQKIKLYLFFSFLVATVAFAFLFPRLTLPFGFSYIIYLMMRPVTLRLTRGTPKQRLGYSILMTLGISFLLLPVFATIYNADTDFAQFTQHLPALQKVLQDKYFAFKVMLFERFDITLNLDPVNYVVGKLQSLGTQLLSQIPQYISSIFEWFLLVPLFLYFFFRESKNFSNWFMGIIPNPIFEKTYVLFSQFNTKFSEYIIAKFVEATLLGSLVTMGLLAVGFPYPFILGFVAGVTNILPYIGPIIGFLPALSIAAISDDPNATMLGMIIVYAVANLIDMVLVFPLLVSKIVNLHPILVVVSVIVGSQIGGIVGMIVIIPFVAFFKLLFKEVYKDLSAHM